LNGFRFSASEQAGGNGEGKNEEAGIDTKGLGLGIRYFFHNCWFGCY
jgi:hypothetical protein